MIKDLAELQELLKLCRKQGVIEINLNGTCIKFGELPRKAASSSRESDKDSDEVPTEGLTQEQLMFFSAPSAEGS